MKTLRRALSLLVLLSAAVAPGALHAREAEEAPRTIAVSAKRFEFEPKEIRLKKGEAVTLAVTSQDVTHGFFSRPLGIDADLSPGRTQEIRVQPKEAGTYTVICDHYCGSGHGGMKMVVIVE
jgi:cytochrome c oxidase subunit 2